MTKNRFRRGTLPPHYDQYALATTKRPWRVSPTQSIMATPKPDTRRAGPRNSTPCKLGQPWRHAQSRPSTPPPELSPKNRSKNAASLVRTRCFFSPCPPSAKNREAGGRTDVIAVPVVWIAPSRNAASTKARVWSGRRFSSRMIGAIRFKYNRVLHDSLGGLRWRYYPASSCFSCLLESPY